MSNTVVNKNKGVRNESTSERFIKLDDLNWNKANENQIPIIDAPVGYGKTFFAVNALPQHFNSSFPFLAVPTKSIKEQTVESYENAEYFNSLELLGTDEQDKIVRVACFSAIVQWLKDGNKIIETPDLVILDEIDELAKWSLCFDGYLLAWNWLLSNRKKIKVVGITATPQLLTEYLRETPFVNISNDLPPKYKARQVEVIQKSSVRTYLKALDYDEHNKALVYVQSAQLCAELAQQYPNAGFMISEYNDDEIKESKEPINQMMINQKVDDFHSQCDNLRDYVLKEKKLPKGYNILFFNDSCHTGMSITDESVKTVICETVAQDSIIQAIGRVRHDLEKVVVIKNGSKKKPFIDNWELVDKFFTNPSIDNYDYLKGYHDGKKEQYQDGSADILTYEDSDGIVRVNPFAKACYDYLKDIYDKLEDEETAHQYFDEMLCPLSVDGTVKYISADEIKKQATNRNRFDESIIAEYLDRDLFKADKKELIERIKLVDKWRETRGWTTLKKCLKESGYQITDGRKINPNTGERERYNVIKPKKSC